MSRHIPILGALVLMVLVQATGCQPEQPFYLKHTDNELNYYKGVATEITYPDVETDRLAEVANDKRPWSLQNLDTKDAWDLSLEEAVQIALANNKVMRNIGGQVQGPPDFITRNPELVPTIYDPALAESDPRTGVEAALSAFDAQLSSSLMWEKTDKPQNLSETTSYFYPDVSDHDLGTFQTRLQKVAASGGTFALTHNVEYDFDRSYYNPTFNSSPYYLATWNVNLVAEARQPLLRGAGTQFNRINGPGTTQGPGNYNGVMIARIRTDIALEDFEASVRNLVNDVETAYWELYYAYRALDSVRAGQDSALTTWRKTSALRHEGGKGGEANMEAQARAQFYLFRSNAEQSLSSLYATESKLRYVLGLASTDGRLIRPKDEPTTAKVSFDWYDVHAETLVRSVELRQQKSIVKERELELIAAKNYLMPQLDAVAQYRWLGYGNRLDGSNSWDATSSTVSNSNAYKTLLSGEYQEWQMGFQLNMPIGFRKEHAGVRHAELMLAKERTKLQEEELEVSHQLASAVRDLESDYVLCQTNFDRRIASQRQVEAVAAAYDTGVIAIDVLLKAQQDLAVADSDYFRSLVNYNKSIATVHYRKGSLLEYDGVYLTEGPWPAKAYFDARRRARARAASTYLDYGFTQPRVINRGPYEQHAGAVGQVAHAYDGGNMEQVPTSAPTPAAQPGQNEPELVPTPDPTPPQAMMEPAVALPPEPQASAQGTGNWTRKTAKTTKASGSAASPTDATGRRLDAGVTPVRWTTMEGAGNNESVAHPSTAATDQSASGWQRVQH